jgi:ribosomal protein S7
MNAQYPTLSKKLIERMIKDLTVKEKRDGDERIVYHATPQCWSELSVDQ